MGLSLSDRLERSRSALRWACWRAILSGLLQFLRELHFIEATRQEFRRKAPTRLQFLRELHFIEASPRDPYSGTGRRCSSFGNCTSLRRLDQLQRPDHRGRCSSFGNCTSLRLRPGNHPRPDRRLQFLRELHFIEAPHRRGTCYRPSRCSSFGNCTSLRHQHRARGRDDRGLQFLRELHFIEASAPGPWTR